MRCEDFDSEKYVLGLIGVALESVKPESVLERYLHCDTCEADKKEFEEFVATRYQPNSDEYGLIYEGLMVVGNLVGHSED